MRCAIGAEWSRYSAGPDAGWPGTDVVNRQAVQAAARFSLPSLLFTQPQRPSVLVSANVLIMRVDSCCELQGEVGKSVARPPAFFNLQAATNSNSLRLFRPCCLGTMEFAEHP